MSKSYKKILRVSGEIHRKIMQIKYSHGLRSVDDTLRFLLDLYSLHYEKQSLISTIYVLVGKLSVLENKTTDRVLHEEILEPYGVARVEDLDSEELKKIIEKMINKVQALKSKLFSR
ncbi:MAG TPA: hypothetical protein ENF55_03375 [Thermoprotei archaeon]|nr:hypothetical protein [Thermoprotei archaeon]